MGCLLFPVVGGQYIGNSVPFSSKPFRGPVGEGWAGGSTAMISLTSLYLEYAKSYTDDPQCECVVKIAGLMRSSSALPAVICTSKRTP